MSNIKIDVNSIKPLYCTANLLNEIDSKLSYLKKKQMVRLRDGRTLIGYLRSVDQFENLVLHKTVERIHVGNNYANIPKGLFIIRGENVVLLGEIDTEKENNLNLLKVSVNTILQAQREQKKDEYEHQNQFSNDDML